MISDHYKAIVFLWHLVASAQFSLGFRNETVSWKLLLPKTWQWFWSTFV